MKHFSINIILCLSIFSLFAQDNKQLNFTRGPGEADNETAKLFGEGIISTGLNEFNATFTPDMERLYYSIRHRTDYFVIMKCDIVDGIFQTPEIAGFSGQYNDADPFISSDGRSLYFCSDRPVNKEDTLRDWNIWRLEKLDKGWGNLTLLSFNDPIKNEMYPTVAKNGNVYFHSDLESKNKGLDLNGTDIYVAEKNKNGYGDYQKVEVVNSADFPEWDPFISPDEDYLIFTSPRKDGFGSGDLYISFRLNNGEWSTIKNLGSKVNSPGMDYCPNLSPDGSLLFFSSYRNELSFDTRPNSYNEINLKLNTAKNGNGDIYFIKSDIIEELRCNR